MVAAIIAGLMAISVPLVIRVLAGLGIGLVTFTGADFALTEIQSFFTSQIGGMPSDMVEVMYLAGFDTGIAIIFAAWSAYITILVTLGAFTKWKV